MDTNVADRPDTPTVGSVCHALVSSIHQTSTNVTAFVRRCRSARADLGPAMRELSELQMVLELLGDYSVSTEERRRQQCTAATIPGEIQTHLRPILTDCITTVLCIDGILQQHGSEKGDGSLVKWTAHGRNDLRELDETLAVYRAVLGLVSDLVSLLISSGSEGQPGDGTSPRVGGMTPDGMRLPDVLRELEVLRSSTFVGPGSREALAAQQLALQVHLGHIITYAKALATSEDGEKAVKAMDEAQKKNAATEKEEARGSIPVPAPLRRFPTTRDAGGVGDNFIVLNKGFENLLVRDDGGRSTGLLFAPHGTPEPGSFMAGGPSTGMMIMDGAGLPGMSGTNTSLQPIRPSNSALTSTRKNFVRRTSAQQQHAMIYTTEKEVAVSRPAGEEVTEEALAFAQVPVHILGRLSLNLVGHVYTGTTTPPPLAAELYPENMSGSSDQTSYVQSLSTMRTDGEYFDDAASARTSDMGSLHDGDLQFSQLDPLKPPAAVTLQPLPPPQTIFASQISLGSQRKPASDLEHVPSPPPPSSSQPPPPHYMYSQPLPLLPTAQPLPPLPTEQPLPPLPPSSQQSQSHSTIPTPTPAFSNPVSSAAPPPPPPAVVPQNGHPHHERAASASASTQSVVYHGPPRPPPSRDHGHTQSLREMRSISTMNTHTFINMQKPLPRTPLVYIPSYPGPFVKTKAVVVGNFSSGKTCMITYVFIANLFTFLSLYLGIDLLFSVLENGPGCWKVCLRGS